LETGPVTARATRDAAESAALSRIAELETQIAHERNAHSRRLIEAELRIRQLREALRSLETKLKRAAEEHILLEARLAGDAYETERLTNRVAELEEQILRGSAPSVAAPAAPKDDGRSARVEAPAESRGVAKFVAARLKKLRSR
jgi:hypothetical protein